MVGSSYAATHAYVHKRPYYPLRAAQQRIDVANWLLDNHYQQGYAGFWNGNVITEMTDGQLELWVVNDIDEPTPDIFKCLQVKTHAEHYPSADRLFLICDAREGLLESSFVYQYYTDVQEVYNDLTFKIFTFANPHKLPE